MLVLSLLIIFGSCEKKCEDINIEIKEIMGEWYRKKILFPKEMTLLNNPKYNITENKNFTIVHFFAADCDKCIDELNKILFTLNDNDMQSQVNIIFISSAPSKNHVLDVIEKVEMVFPVFYDKHYYSYKLSNDFPISEEAYNTVLLNSKNEILIFGAFYDNSKALELYLKAINCTL
ncbi:MAG: hypothetical protein Q4G16_09085 [Cruoricaptor ignavus]|nr:hypothetical protein [Cruoricaptor ignavus]